MSKKMNKRRKLKKKKDRTKKSYCAASYSVK